MITIKRHDILLQKRGLLATGMHIVWVESVTESPAPERTPVPWDDVTPQIAIRFKNNNGFVTMWLNMVGYMTDKDYIEQPDNVVFKMHPLSKVWYAVDIKTNRRVVSDKKTNVCYGMLQRLAYSCGFNYDANIELSDLIGRKLSIKVQELNNFPKVTDFYLLKK